MEDSIFTKIIKGEIPSHKIYEDEQTFAFLDIDPLLKGHVLVVPKKQIDHIDDLPDEDYQALMATVKKVAHQVKQVLGVRRAAILVMGFDVPHAHVHVVPANVGNEIYASLAERIDSGRQAPEPDHEALAMIAEKLRF
jgi:histidine triad (HIT) family protein